MCATLAGAMTLKETAPEARAEHGSRIERAGVRYLRSLASRKRAVAADAVHVLNDGERAELLRIERRAVLRAAVAGALSGLACALPAMVLGPPGAAMEARVKYYALVGVVTVVASVLEIVFLYWDGLRAVHELAHAAGMDLADEAQVSDPTSALWSLARAALEMPNPPDAVPGIDPLREASKWRLALLSALYKLKVTLTGFLAKALLRRALGRAATRAVLELVAMPVTAVWDAMVCRLILREARLRVLGPSAAIEFAALLFPSSAALSEEARRCALRAVVSAAVRTADMHPNLVALLRTVRAKAAVEEVDSIDSSEVFLAEIAALDADGRTLVLRTLATASIIDGRIAADEEVLLRQAFEACGMKFDPAPIERLRRAFVSGEAIPPERLLAIRSVS